MDNSSTLSKSKAVNATDGKQSKQPCRLTVELIRQFARAYVHESRLNIGISNIIAN